MPALSWIGKRTGPRHRDAWVGVCAHKGGLVAACATTTPQGRKPRIQACHHVDAAQGLPGLRTWWSHFGTRRVGASMLLGTNEYQIVQIDAPAVAPGEVRSAARWQIQELIDFPAEEAALDCLRIPAASPSQQSPKLLTVISRNNLVRANLGQWQAAGLTLNVIDIPEMALRNLAVLTGGAQACGFVHVGIDETRLILIWQEELCMSRQLPFGGFQLRSMEEFPRGAQLERLGLEIQRTVDAFERQFSAAHLAQVWVSSVFDPQAVVEALANQLSVKVQRFSLPDWIDFDTDPVHVDLDRRIDTTLAIGAALRQEAFA